jgi:hypothetical protein
LCWAGAAKRLKDRDTWIGWDAVTCANRLKLVVQLRRFVIPQEARRPNLASQCLGLALRQLPDAWQEKYGYRPLLAESFHDPVIHQGTLYKVTNWTALGFTKGFKRHRADFYQDLQSPKQLWIRPLKKNAQQKLDYLPAAWTSDTECAHGRIEYRELRLAAFDLDTSLFPGARQVASLTRYYQQKYGGEPKQEPRHFILSSEEGVLPLARLARIGREHWLVENKNHWRRDATRWREDQSVRRKPKGAKNLALLRRAILALRPQEKFSSLNAAFDHYIEHRAEALQLLTRTAPLQCP